MRHENILLKISELWAKKRAEEAATMCAKRKPTEEEIERAMVIGKWFFGWTDETGPCPIGCMNDYWHKKLCALFEWIAVLESNPPHEVGCYNAASHPHQITPKEEAR